MKYNTTRFRYFPMRFSTATLCNMAMEEGAYGPCQLRGLERNPVKRFFVVLQELKAKCFKCHFEGSSSRFLKIATMFAI